MFHHGGYYPAYAKGGLGGLGTFMAALQPGGFRISIEARRHFSNALFAMASYTNFKDWTIGLSGRHPHTGAMSNQVVEAFAYLALMGGIDNPDDNFDKKLAREFLRLDTEINPLRNKFTGLSAANTPEGFFVLNHASLGVHRVGNSMVSIKGYNSDVWGSEIYTNDNRFGRYQSYGAVEILNGGSLVSRSESGFSESGWDWNRLPGTTTIHLPLNLLESPSTGTLMARSEEDFAGASSLLGQYGVFGMKLKEKNDIYNTNYTQDFVARKSVFTFGKRLICIGTDISNSNNLYPTETTLFQNAIANRGEIVFVNGNLENINNYNFESGQTQQPTILSDLNENFYRISERNKVIISGGEQVSAHNKTKAETRGNFITARIDHGQAPTNANYEYMIMLKPTPSERIGWTTTAQYQVLQADEIAHIVFDEVSKVTACVSFELTQPTDGPFKSISKETLLMYQKNENGVLNVSVCDPSLHLPIKVRGSESTGQNGQTVQKQLVLDGRTELLNPTNAVEVLYQNGQTILTVNCCLGIPVEFKLKTPVTSSPKINRDKISMTTDGNAIILHGQTTTAMLFDSLGRIMETKDFSSLQKVFYSDKNQVYFLKALLSDSSIFSQKLIL